MTTEAGAGGPTFPFTDDEIHAYVDGQLAPERRRDIEQVIAGDPEVAARVAFYRRLNSELHRRYDDVLTEPTPSAWRPAPVWQRSGRDRRRPTLRHVGMAAAWLFAGLIAGWSTHDLLVPPRVIERVVERPASIFDQAAVAYAVFTPEVRHPVEVRADEAQHLMTWLSNRMGRPIKAPNLSDAGWHLMGGRLLPVVEDPPGTRRVACQFMFERADGARLTVYYKDAASPNGATAFRYAEQQSSDIGVVYWYDDKLGYAVAGKLPKDQLQALAREIYDQFNS